MIKIPFNCASLNGRELEYLEQAASSGHISGDGPFTRKCQALLESELSVHKALLTTSCTHALEMCAILLNISEGDEVIVPSYTFVTTANAFALHGAKPVFADSLPDTLNIDPNHVRDLITPKTKAVVPVHYAGVGCELEELVAICEEHGIALIEDNAHGLFGLYKGQPLGSFGALATQSFHETKNFTCGEGGALLINDDRFAERAEIIREKGTDRSLFFRGMVDKYTWRDVGSSYLPSDILAAFLYAQLEERDRIQKRRKEIWETYNVRLKNWADDHSVQLPIVPAHCDQAYHMFYLVLPSEDLRNELMAGLRDRGILSVFHYLPLHLSDMGRRFGGREGDCPVAEDRSPRLLRLPFSNDLSPDDQDTVCEAIIQSTRNWP